MCRSSLGVLLPLLPRCGVYEYSRTGRSQKSKFCYNHGLPSTRSDESPFAEGTENTSSERPEGTHALKAGR